jgi:hypothetical protein
MSLEQMQPAAPFWVFSILRVLRANLKKVMGRHRPVAPRHSDSTKVNGAVDGGAGTQPQVALFFSDDDYPECWTLT